jgi:hypothetical protein
VKLNLKTVKVSLLKYPLKRRLWASSRAGLEVLEKQKSLPKIKVKVNVEFTL